MISDGGADAAAQTVLIISAGWMRWYRAIDVAARVLNTD
jgi:hypothetical protein